MRYPHDVVLVRPSGQDEYGNASNDFSLASETPLKGFMVKPGERLLLPPSADVRDGDRVRVNGVTYSTDADEIVSPSKRVLWDLTLTEVSRGA